MTTIENNFAYLSGLDIKSLVAHNRQRPHTKNHIKQTLCIYTHKSSGSILKCTSRFIPETPLARTVFFSVSINTQTQAISTISLADTCARLDTQAIDVLTSSIHRFNEENVL